MFFVLVSWLKYDRNARLASHNKDYSMNKSKVRVPYLIYFKYLYLYSRLALKVK